MAQQQVHILNRKRAQRVVRDLVAINRASGCQLGGEVSQPLWKVRADKQVAPKRGRQVEIGAQVEVVKVGCELRPPKQVICEVWSDGRLG